MPQRWGRPRTRPRRLTADKGYDSRPFRHWLRRKGVASCIPSRTYRHRRWVGRRPQAVRRFYQHRWHIERSFAWLQQFRRLTVRWDYHLEAYHGFFTVACIVICLRKF